MLSRFLGNFFQLCSNIFKDRFRLSDCFDRISRSLCNILDNRCGNLLDRFNRRLSNRFDLFRDLIKRSRRLGECNRLDLRQRKVADVCLNGGFFDLRCPESGIRRDFRNGKQRRFKCRCFCRFGCLSRCFCDFLDRFGDLRNSRFFFCRSCNRRFGCRFFRGRCRNLCCRFCDGRRLGCQLRFRGGLMRQLFGDCFRCGFCRLGRCFKDLICNCAERRCCSMNSCFLRICNPCKLNLRAFAENLGGSVLKPLRDHNFFQTAASDKRILAEEFQRGREYDASEAAAFDKCTRFNSEQPIRTNNLRKILQLRKSQRTDDPDGRCKNKLLHHRSAEDAVIHERADHQIAIRNTKHAVLCIQLCDIAGCHEPRAFRSQLTDADRSGISEVYQCGRITHKECCCEVLVKFLRQEHIAELLTVIERSVFKLVQCLRDRQGQQTLIHAECIAAKAHHAERDLKLRLICDLSKRICREHRMRMHLLDALVEIVAGLADLRRKEPVLGSRTEPLLDISHQLVAGFLLIGLRIFIRPVDINLDRAVEDQRELALEPARDRQGAQVRAACKCHAADLSDGIRNAQADQRIAVHEGIFMNGAEIPRQTDLLILARCRKCKRSDVADGIREHDPRRTHAAGECVHINDLQTFRNDDMPDGFQSGEGARADTAHTPRQEDRGKRMLRFIRTDIKPLCEIRCDRRIALRDLKNVVPDDQLFRLLCSQNIVKLLHEIGDRFDAGSGKNLLLRPVHLDLRTENEVFNDLALGKIGRDINIRKAGASGECIRLDLCQRRGQLDRKQTRRIPECLRFRTADALRNLETLAALRAAERTVRNDRIVFQRSTSLDRSGHRLGDLLRKDAFGLRIIALMNRAECNAFVKDAVRNGSCFRKDRSSGFRLCGVGGFFLLAGCKRSDQVICGDLSRNRRGCRRCGSRYGRRNGCRRGEARSLKRILTRCNRNRLHIGICKEVTFRKRIRYGSGRRSGYFRCARDRLIGGTICKRNTGAVLPLQNGIHGLECCFRCHSRDMCGGLLLHIGQIVDALLQFRNHADFFLHIRQNTDLFLYFADRLDLFLQLGDRFDLFLYIADRFDLRLHICKGVHFLFEIRDLLGTFAELGDRIDGLLNIRDRVNTLLHTGDRVDLFLHTGDRIDLLLHSGDRVDLLLDTGERVDLLLHTGECIDLFLHTGDRTDLILHTGNRVDLVLHTGNGLDLLLHRGYRIDLILHLGDRFDLFLHLADRIELFLNIGNGADLAFQLGDQLCHILHIADRIQLFLQCSDCIGLFLESRKRTDLCFQLLDDAVHVLDIADRIDLFLQLRDLSDLLVHLADLADLILNRRELLGLLADGLLHRRDLLDLLLHHCHVIHLLLQGFHCIGGVLELLQRFVILLHDRKILIQSVNGFLINIRDTVGSIFAGSFCQRCDLKLHGSDRTLHLLNGSTVDLIQLSRSRLLVLFGECRLDRHIGRDQLREIDLLLRSFRRDLCKLDFRQNVIIVPLRRDGTRIQPCDRRVGDIAENTLHFILVMNDARHMQLCQERAVSERGLRDRFAADRDIHALQQLAVPERTVADRLDALRQHQTAEGNTVRKGTGTDTLDAVAEQNGLQCLISAEQLIRNIPQMRRQPDGFQRRQIAERTDANLRNGIRNDDAAQTLAAGKRTVVNIFRALLEDHLFQRIQRRKSIGRNAVNGARDQQTLNAFARQAAHRSGCNNSIGSGNQQGRIGSDLKQGS